MYSIAGRIIDFTDDPIIMASPEFRALLSGNVKHASASGDDSEYAVVLVGKDRHRRYPIFDKLAAITSATFFDEHAEQLHPYIRVVAAWHIKKACELFQLPVPAEVERYSRVDAPLTTNELQLQLLRDPSPIKLAELADPLDRMVDFWQVNRRRMTFAEMSKKASHIVKLAGKKQLPSEIVDYAAKPKIGSLFALAIKQRQGAVKHDKVAVEEFTQILKTASTDKPEVAITMMTALDEKHHLRGQYGRSLFDPYMAAYGAFYKTAEKNTEPVELDDKGLVYKLQTLAAESNLDHYHNILSETGLRNFRKDPVGTFQKLPKEVQDAMIADFDAHLERQNKAMDIKADVSKERLKLYTKDINEGKYPGYMRSPNDSFGPTVAGPHKPKIKEHFPEQVNEPITAKQDA